MHTSAIRHHHYRWAADVPNLRLPNLINSFLTHILIISKTSWKWSLTNRHTESSILHHQWSRQRHKRTTPYHTWPIPSPLQFLFNCSNFAVFQRWISTHLSKFLKCNPAPLNIVKNATQYCKHIVNFTVTKLSFSDNQFMHISFMVSNATATRMTV